MNSRLNKKIVKSVIIKPIFSKHSRQTSTRIAHFLAASLVLSSLSYTALADPIYKWKDAEGRTHYSSTPNSKSAKPAKLPNLTKIDLDRQIEQIKRETPRNCSSHGGEDCSAGADTDGSVICSDGYRDAILPFRFHCMQVRLEAKLSVLLEGDEVPKTMQEALIAKNKKVTGLVLSLRNLSGVDALDIVPALRVSRKYANQNQARKFLGRGKRKISAYGVETYSIPLEISEAEDRNSLLRALIPAVSCTNCSSVRTDK